MNKLSVSIFWFRRDLRLSDNHGLWHALKSDFPVLPIFIFDSNILTALNDEHDKRVNFIYETLAAIHEQLNTAGSSLYVIHDKPLAAFKKICTEFDVRQVFTNRDYEPYATQRDQEVAEFLGKQKISFHDFKDQVVAEKNEVLKSDGKPYTIFTPYSQTWKKYFHGQKINEWPSEKLVDHFFKTQPFPFPQLSSIGFQQADVNPILLPAVDQVIISGYDKTRNIPSVNGTTRLSVHLRFGTVSIRKLVKTASKLNEQWLNELIWREFFMMILWHFPQVVTRSFKPAYDNIRWRNNEKEFEAWRKGETGYPIVDAGMRELNETGFMHNRVRMITASFLTKHLLIDWRWGEAYFAEKLLDYELSSNNGNWQWAAGSGCDSAPYFRIFNPSLQTKRFDPKLVYIKKWIKHFDQYLIPPIVEHEFARKRALAEYEKAVKK